MDYTKQIIELAEKIRDEAQKLKALESSRKRWTEPEGEYVSIGSANYYVVRKDGVVTPGLEAIQRETVKLHEGLIFAAKSRIEGLRFKLVQVAKNGGAA